MPAYIGTSWNICDWLKWIWKLPVRQNWTEVPTLSVHGIRGFVRWPLTLRESTVKLDDKLSIKLYLYIYTKS